MDSLADFLKPLGDRGTLPMLPSTPGGNDTKPPRRQAAVRRTGAQRGARIGGAHERLADEEGMHAGAAHPRHVGGREYAAFGDHEPLARYSRQQVERGVERRPRRCADCGC